jgi:type IV secretion system protein TrbL
MAHRQPMALGSGGRPRRSAPLAAPGKPPAWAQRLARRQHTTQAVMVTAQAVREGDRPAAGAAPELKDKS